MDLRCARAACLLESPADRLVHQLKYRGWRTLAAPLARRIASVPLPQDVAEEARHVVPVPTTAARARERGYNQAEVLAREYASITGRRVLRALLRVSAAASQTALQPVARGANVAGAFIASPREIDELHGRHLLLVDDVLTTGATAAECARTLVEAGARVVSLLTFARALSVRGVPQTR